ncbi:MAG: tetratricopeptide repeat protein [Hydrococcus sp. Prado102]|nr:tetratricopeptide repeat protein [Hydrococcus sp. Prado102]
MVEKSKPKTIQRVLIIVASAAFLGTLVVPIFEMFSNTSQPANNAATQENTAAAYEQLQQKATGYEEVLKREPNNPMALNELAKTRYQMYQLKGSNEDLKKMVDPLDKLVKLYPEQKELKALLEQVKTQVAQTNQPSKSESKK